MRSPRRVVICGGGVAALEALLALRDMLAIRPHIDLVAPDAEFVYAPMTVAEPFGLARVKRFDLAAIAADLGAELHVGSLAEVHTTRRHVTLADGSRLRYDAALVAVGARRRPWLAGSTCFDGADTGTFADLLRRLEKGEAARVAFTAPAGVAWTLPLYELALLTASRLADHGIAEVELAVITPESEPLSIFGAGVSRMIRGALGDRGIRVRTGARVEGLAHGRLELGSGDELAVDEVVTLPRLEGPGLPGLKADEEGFIAIDEHCRVLGARNVYAAGDGTVFPIKQGGIAAQQADVAAEALAASFGAPLAPAPFEPRLRAILLTGIAPIYLRARVGEDGQEEAEISADALWHPSAKIAGRYLGPYLALAASRGSGSQLRDRPAFAQDPEAALRSHREARELALICAQADARTGDFRSAISWLEVVEEIDGILPSGYSELREAWQARAERPDAPLAAHAAQSSRPG